MVDFHKALRGEYECQKKHISIDIETFSRVNLKQCGTYKYVECPDFEILLFAYKFPGEETVCIDLTQEHIPDRVWDALNDPMYLIHAFNATFERLCINKHFGLRIPPERYRCTMVHAAYLGLPLSLDQVGAVLKTSAQKDKAGTALINFFCVPCKPKKATKKDPNPDTRTRNLPHHDPVKWEAFKRYCAIDVDTENAVYEKIKAVPLPEKELRLYALDQRINDKGVEIDQHLARTALLVSDTNKATLMAEARRISGLDNPGSVQQLIDWLNTTLGDDAEDTIDSLKKDQLPFIRGLIKGSDNESVLNRMMDIRAQVSKTSIRKYVSMLKSVCEDSRVRGLLQFYGANRTGRWAGRIIQVHNLARIKLSPVILHLLRQDLLKQDLGWIEMCYGPVADMLSQLIRTAIVAPKGRHFKIADFAAIEARVIAWLSGEQWRMDVFRTHGKIYEASASQMFKVPLDSIVYKDENGKTCHGPNYDMRQRGKVAELALGYQGGVNALIAMGALEMGVPESELQGIVDAWRAANPAIKQLWYDCQKAAILAIETGQKVPLHHGITFHTEKGLLFITLPSGRRLSYMRAALIPGKFGPQIQYEGLHQESKKWVKLKTYGGKLVENIVQAIARDCLAETLLKLDEEGYDTCMHVHDEVVIECDNDDERTCSDIDKLMGTPPEWALDMPLKAESYESAYYRKD